MIEFTYDNEHHLKTTTTHPALDTSITSRQNYYANGLVLESFDPKGVATTNIYDASGLLNTSKVGKHPVIDFDYDSLGRLVKLTPQIGGATEFSYNHRGQVTDIKDSLGENTTFTYDAIGQNKTVTDRNNQTTTMDYTPDKHLEKITFHNGENIKYFYDDRSNLITRRDTLGNQAGDTLYGYDEINRLIQQTDSNGFTLKYTYDAAGNLKTLTYPGNKVLTYGYDALNRMISFTTWLGDETRYYYDAAGRLSVTAHSNGTQSDYDYDGANRLIKLRNLKSSGEIIHQQRFELDDNGNRVKITVEQPQAPVERYQSNTYIYNQQRNRLLQVRTPDSFTYRYHDAEGQLERIGPTALFELSSTLEDAPSTTSAAQAQNTHVFNARHQLAGIHQAFGARQDDYYDYDGANNRIKVSRDGVIRYYIYDASSNLLAEADENKQITQYYIHGAGLSQMIEGNNSTAIAYTYHFDAIGSTMAMTDDAQNIINQYAYSPYGRSLGKTETKPQPFTYVGQYGVQAEANNIYYMRARYYEADTGRFISEDPLGLAAGVNLFGYASSNPVMFIDPQGLLSLSIGVSAESTAIKGGAIAGGAYITSGDKNGIDIGLHGTKSKTTGFNAGVGLNIDVMKGGQKNISGESHTVSACFLVICGRIHKNNNGDITGGGVTIGLGLPGGFSGQENSTSTLGTGKGK